MRIFIIRHAEPNYESGHLTPKGLKEAEILSTRLVKEKIDYVYISSLLRAQETARPYLLKTGKSSTTYEWLQEFPIPVKDEINGGKRRCWDFPADYFASLEHVYDNSKFLEIPIFKDPDYTNYYNNVMKNFDDLLARHGYERYKNYYKVTKENHDTLAFFCHLGVGLCLISRLVNIPFPVLAQHFSPLCTSVTCIYTEERKPGIAQFRVSYLGDYSHLTEANEPPSFCARFRECASDNDRWED